MRPSPSPVESIPRPRRPNFPCFDGLRAIAAVAVVITHTGFDTGATYRFGLAGDLFARGDIGVPIFFAISGFLLYYPFAQAHRDNALRPAIGRFYRRRVLRLYPAYWAALAVLTVFFGVSLGSGIDPFLYVTLTQIYSNHTALRGLPQAWSLCVEITFYLLLPLYSAVMARATRRSQRWLACEISGLAVLVVTSVVFRAVIQVINPSFKRAALLWLPAQLDLFAIGMAFAVWSVAGNTGTSSLRRAGQTVSRHPAVAWIVGAAAFLVVSLSLHLPKGIVDPTARQSFARQALYGLVAVCMLAPAVFDDGSGLIRRFLRFRPIAFVGVVSYGVYLWHKTFVTKVVEWTGGHPELQHGNFFVVLGIVLAISITIAAISHRWLETPLSRRFGR